jgi:cytohesin
MAQNNSQVAASLAAGASAGGAWQQNPPVKCRRETLRKQLRCHNVIKLFTECGRDPKVGDYIVYLVATTNLCHKREQPYVLSSLFLLGANPNATYRRRHVLSIVLDSIGSDYIRSLQAVVIARTFISYGADPNVRDRRGNTFLHYAVQYGWIDDSLVEVPLSRGADPNARNRDGETPLHMAVKCRCMLHTKAKIVKLLLEYGADPRIRDRSGRTPLDYAEDEEIAEMLRAALKSVV